MEQNLKNIKIFDIEGTLEAEIVKSGLDTSVDSISKLKLLIENYKEENKEPKFLNKTWRFDTLLFEILKTYPQYKNVDICLETGTYLGDSAKRMSVYFKEVHTIEIIDSIYEKAKTNLKKLENITCYLGDSLDLLPELLQKMPYPLFFYIDAHSSSYNGTNTNETVPVIKELEIINKYHPYNDIILIDDLVLFGEKKYYADWSDISVNNILNTFDKKNILHSQPVSYYKGLEHAPCQYLILLNRK